MARSLNKVMLIGHLGADPELKYTPSGDAVVNFRIATTRSWTDRNTQERRDVTEWHTIVAWRELADVCHRFLRKGSLVYIEGRLETRSWDDRDTNKKVYRTEIIADEMNMLDSRRDSDESGREGGRESYRDSGPPRDSGSSRDRSHLRPVSGGGQPLDDDRPLDLDDTPF